MEGDIISKTCLVVGQIINSSKAWVAGEIISKAWVVGDIICRKALVVVVGIICRNAWWVVDHLEEGLGGGGGDQHEGLLVGGQHYFWERPIRGNIVWWLRVDNSSYISGSRMLV